MTRSISLSPEQRAALLDRYRKDPEPEVRFRAHILLLLDDGHPWVTVASLLFCSSRTIDRGSSGVSGGRLQEQSDQGSEEGLAPPPHIVHELEEPQVQRQLLL